MKAEGAASSVQLDSPADDKWQRCSRPDLIWFAVIFLAALGLRVTYVFQLRSCPFYGHEMMDPLYHHQWAQAFAAGETFVEGAYFRAPLYPWFLGTIYWLFGTASIVPRIVQAVLGSLSCGLLFLIGRQVFSRTVGVLAGLCMACYWPSLYFDAELLIVVVIVLLDLVLLWLLLRTGARRSPALWLASGVVLGLSAIARPNVLLFGPAILIWLAVMHRSSWRRVAGYGACFVLGAAGPILPIAIRNYTVGQDAVLISSQAGVNFYIGNNPQADGISAVIPGMPAEWWPGYYAQIERAEQAEGRKLKGSEVSGYYWREALKFMGERPGRALGLMLKKLGFFWTYWEVSNNQDMGFVTSTYTPVVRFLPLGFWLVGPLGGLGLVLSLREGRRLFPLWGFVIIYMVTVVAFFVTARYRAPCVAVLVLLASMAACRLVESIRKARWKSVAWAAVVLLIAAAVVARAPEGVHLGVAQGYREAGVALLHQGKLSEAEELLAESLRRWPGQARGWYSMGHLHMTQGKLPQAQECFQQALSIDPSHAGARNNLAAVLATQGKLDQAIKEFEFLLQSDPDDGTIHANLGSALIQRGRVDEGLEHLLRAVQIDPAGIRNLVVTAQALIQKREFGTAMRVLRAGLTQSPEELNLLLMLSRLSATCPQVGLREGGEALGLAEQACRLTAWKDARAIDTLAAAHFSVGQTDRAVEFARRAKDLAVLQGRRGLAERIGARLSHYQSAAAPPSE